MQPHLSNVLTYAHLRTIYVATCVSVGILGLFSGCGGGASTNPSDGSNSSSSSSLSMKVFPSALTLPAEGSIGRVTVNLTRSENGNTVKLTVSGLPVNASSAVESQPGTGNSGIVEVNPGTAMKGTYPLTITANDGTAQVSAGIALTLDSGTETRLPTPIQWSLGDIVVGPVSDSTHSILAVKDSSVTRYNNEWQLMNSDVDSRGYYSLEYRHFADWTDALTATPYYMDQTNGLGGYHTSPTIFYFTPQKKWYLVYQSPQPQYSTTDDPTQPSTWTVPQNFYDVTPSNVDGWLDFDVICDSAKCYLFFANDKGGIYRASSSINDFPKGFGNPELVMQAANAQDLFEGVQVYTLKGMNQYLMIVEAAQQQNWTRYFRGFILASLDGPITPIPHASSWDEPFAGLKNVSFASGVSPWTNDISHGDLVRSDPDETESVDPANLQFLIQGVQPKSGATDYNAIPWRLGLLTRVN